MSDNHNDYADSVVPAHARRPWVNILFVWLGFIIVVGIMAVGGGMAPQMTAKDFFTAIIVGNIVLGAFALISGYVGADSGKTFNQLMSQVFEGFSWRIVSLYVPIILIGWFGVEAAIFGKLLGEIFDLSLTQSRVIMFSATLIFATTSYLGFSAIRLVSIVAVPLIVIIGLYALYLASGNSDLRFATASNRLTVDAGIAIVMGSWIMGVLTCVPDLTRYSKSRMSGALVAASGILLGNIFTFSVGGVAAAFAGESDPAKLLISFGFIPFAVLLALANIWTTNDNNMYSAALNISRATGVKRTTAVIICALIAAPFAAMDPTSMDFLFTFLIFMGNTAPALGGVVLGAYLWNRFSSRQINSIAGGWAGWLLGSYAGFLVGNIWSIPIGFLTGFSIWLIFSIINTRTSRNT